MDPFGLQMSVTVSLCSFGLTGRPPGPFLGGHDILCLHGNSKWQAVFFGWVGMYIYRNRV